VITEPAPGETAHPALALVNSRRHAPDGSIVDDLDGADPALYELRDAVGELLIARIECRVPARGVIAEINAAAAVAPAVPRLVWDAREGPRVEWTLADVRARAAADAIALVTGPQADDLRACGAPGCMRLLLRDHPRRQWCSTRCGDRVRARRYYRRHR
jgi:predicted RNA-binding Zn ribbon-like protein